MDVFVSISVAVTGFTETELTGTGLVERYRETVSRDIPLATLERLARAVGDGNVDLARTEEARYAKAIAALWYTGVWVRPTASTAEPAARQIVVIPEGYAEALVWKTFDARPPGVAAPGHGSWRQAPAGPAVSFGQPGS